MNTKLNQSNLAKTARAMTNARVIWDKIITSIQASGDSAASEVLLTLTEEYRDKLQDLKRHIDDGEV